MARTLCSTTVGTVPDEVANGGVDRAQCHAGVSRWVECERRFVNNLCEQVADRQMHDADTDLNAADVTRPSHQLDIDRWTPDATARIASSDSATTPSLMRSAIALVTDGWRWVPRC